MIQQSLNLTEIARSDSDLIEELEAFQQFGATTHVDSLNGVKYYINEFWTSRQRQGNRLHELSYRACFKPQLPRFFIDRLTVPGDVVYDPFMGRGTTLLEAAICGRIPFGNDTNPLSKVLVEPRLCPPMIEEINLRLEAIPWHTFCDISDEKLLVFFHPDTLAKIEGLRHWLLTREENGELDIVDKWIRMVAVNRLTGHSKGFFSVYTLPPNRAVTVYRQTKINENRNQTPPLRDIPSIILKKSKALLSQELPECNKFLTCSSPADATPEILSGTVRLTVTSPPFLNIIDYKGDNWLRCWFLGIDPKGVKITNCSKLENWIRFIRNTLKELCRVTVTGGYVALEVGEVRGGKVKLEQSVIEAARGLPLLSLGIIINQQEFTKTSNCWGVSNNSSGTNSNRIVLFKKCGKD